MHVRALLATTAVLALTLTGCGNDDPKPKMQPTKTTQPSATETAEPENETPEEFIERWLTVETEMFNSGDTVAYRAITRGCGVCADVADDVDQFYADGGYFRTKGTKLERTKPLGNNSHLVWIKGAPTTYARSSSASPEHLTGGRALIRVELNQVQERWNLKFQVNRPL